MELCNQDRLDAFPGFILRPEFITELLNNVICCYTQVSRTFFDLFQYSIQYANYDSKWFVLALIKSPLAIEVPEQFINVD
jgi:hypothetical protein